MTRTRKGQQSLANIARDKGNTIARELRLKKSSELVQPHIRSLFDNALTEMAMNPEAAAFARLQGLFRQVGRRSALQTAVALLDQSWRVPTGTRLDDDVVKMIRRCYFDAPREEWKLSIGDELRDRQFHPFPRVRRVVHRVRELERVDVAEVEEIQDLERGYPDLRGSIAHRIILHNQVEHLDAVITYLSGVLLREAAELEEKKAAKRIYFELGRTFAKSREALEVLYLGYLLSFENREMEPRGFLALALAQYGDEIIPQLEHEHATNKEHREAIQNVLYALMKRGSVSALRVLLSILVDGSTSDVRGVCHLLSKGFKTVAGRAQDFQSSSALREEMKETVPVLRRRQGPDLRRLLDEFEALEWGEVSIDPLIQRVLDGGANSQLNQELRRLGEPAIRKLLAVAEDASLEPTGRKNALEMLGRLGGVNRFANRGGWGPALASRLWSLFRDERSDEVRLGVIRALAALELDPGAEARDELYSLIQSGSSALEPEIRAAWHRIFPPADLAGGASQEGASE